MTAVCRLCGATAECADDSIPEGWTVQFENGRLERICAVCARANIRAIEGKLSEEYWE